MHLLNTAVLRKPVLNSGQNIIERFWRHAKMHQKIICLAVLVTYKLHTQILPNCSQQYATFLDLFISTDALNVSDASSAHHQEHITVHTPSGIINCNDRVR
jgi:hypothetical protein